MVNIPKSRSEYRGGTAKLSPLCILICPLKTKISRMKKKEAFAAIAEFVYDSSRAGYYTLSGGVKMSTKFLFPDWENEDDDSQDLCGRMREMAEEAARRSARGFRRKRSLNRRLPQPKALGSGEFLLRSGGADRKSQNSPVYRGREPVRL